MITKLGEELTHEEKVSLLRDGVKRRENRGEALGTALGGCRRYTWGHNWICWI